MNICSLYCLHEMSICSIKGVVMRGAYRKRRVNLPPKFQNFKPSGIPRKMLDNIVLTFDEYEAIRLADYLGKEHLEASKMMNISRPTFTRLIDRARKKMAQTIIEGMELTIEGGNVDFTNALHRCRTCGEEEVRPINAKTENCNECGSEDMEDLLSGPYNTIRKEE